MPRGKRDAPVPHRGHGSAGKEESAEPRFLVVGHVRAPHGVRGELRITILTDFPERFQEQAELWMGSPPRLVVVQRARIQGDVARVKLLGFDDRDSVEGFRGSAVLVPLEQAMPLPDDTYYIHEVVGLEVWTDEGERLGVVSDVLSLPANDIYVVAADEKEIWLPAIEDVVLNIDIHGGRMVVRLLPGLV